MPELELELELEQEPEPQPELVPVPVAIVAKMHVVILVRKKWTGNLGTKTDWLVPALRAKIAVCFSGEEQASFCLIRHTTPSHSSTPF